MKLTKDDITSPTWLKLKPELERMIEEMRIQNEALTLNEFQTTVIRSRIVQTKLILALGELPPQEQSADAE